MNHASPVLQMLLCAIYGPRSVHSLSESETAVVKRPLASCVLGCFPGGFLHYQ